jgi:hypothetical protein
MKGISNELLVGEKGSTECPHADTAHGFSTIHSNYFEKIA